MIKLIVINNIKLTDKLTSYTPSSSDRYTFYRDRLDHYITIYTAIYYN